MRYLYLKKKKLSIYSNDHDCPYLNNYAHYVIYRQVFISYIEILNIDCDNLINIIDCDNSTIIS